MVMVVVVVVLVIVVMVLVVVMVVVVIYDGSDCGSGTILSSKPVFRAERQLAVGKAKSVFR